MDLLNMKYISIRSINSKYLNIKLNDNKNCIISTE